MENVSEELKKQIIAELEKRTPWNVIAETYHVSTKTIDKINKQHLSQQSSVVDGEVSAKAFELFEEGMNPVDVVIQLRQNPDLVTKLYFAWSTLKEKHIVVPCRVCGGPLMVCFDNDQWKENVESWLYQAIDPCHPSCRRFVSFEPSD